MMIMVMTMMIMLLSSAVRINDKSPTNCDNMIIMPMLLNDIDNVIDDSDEMEMMMMMMRAVSK